MTSIWRHLIAVVDRLRGGPRAAFEGGAEACIAIVSRDGRLVAHSGSANFLFSQGIPDAFADGFEPGVRGGIAAALLGGAAVRLEAGAQRRDGAPAVYELVFEPRPDGLITVLVLDRTADVMAREALRRETERAHLEVRAVAERLADLSHEMKTPLTAVLGFADTMVAETFGPLGSIKYQEYAGHIRSSGQHLLDLVEAILDLAKIDADRMPITRVRMDPAEVAGDCAEMVRQIAERAGLKLIVEIGDDLGEAFLDPRAVRQILLNLLSNAVKFTSDGEVRLAVAASDNELTFTVRDTGIGMSAEMLAKLGARFTEVQGPGVRGSQGAGIGLALAVRLAELLGGGIDFSSAPGEGLTARLTLPRGQSIERDDATRAPAAIDAAIPTQLERIDAYRREVAARRQRASSEGAVAKPQGRRAGARF